MSDPFLLSLDPLKYRWRANSRSLTDEVFAALQSPQRPSWVIAVHRVATLVIDIDTALPLVRVHRPEHELMESFRRARRVQFWRAGPDSDEWWVLDGRRCAAEHMRDILADMLAAGTHSIPWHAARLYQQSGLRVV